MKPDRIVGIQARLGSRRLPRKVLADIRGLTMLRRVWDACYGDWTRIVLIPETQADDELAQYCRSEKMEYIRGPEYNVLGRYQIVVETFRPTYLVRVCADAPFLKADWIRRAIDIGGPAFVPDALHGGTTADWKTCIMEEKSDEHAGHDWFLKRGTRIELVPKGYFSVNTEDDLRKARRLVTS